jgi:hypothetical protein
VCHTTPLAAVSNSVIALEERHTGVGCESCHGGASNWLAEHTTASWSKLTKEEKQKKGMTPLDDLSVRAAVCTGCHIGSGPVPGVPARDVNHNFIGSGPDPGPVPGVPARDVNHDLIAAGHPRLTFEFAAFTANTPPHWNTEKKKIDETVFWSQGQLASARAALELLAYRAGDTKPGFSSSASFEGKPWPEFAEYDCYACHHQLLSDSNRVKRGYGGSLPGSLPWSDWYYFMPRTMSKLPGGLGNAAVADNLGQLDKLMRAPDTNRAGIALRATSSAGLIEQWAARWRDRPPTNKDLRALLLQHPRANWDQATQFYLGMSALSNPADAAEQAALDSIYRYLQFRTIEEVRYHSPREFRVEDFDKLLNALDK